MPLGIAIAVNDSPDAEVADAVEVEVLERMGLPTRYRLRYGLDIDAGDLPLLIDDRLGPGSHLSILVPGDPTDVCLVKGPVTGQRASMVHGGAGSKLDVLGADRLTEMDREAKSVVWSEVKDSDVAAAVFSAYGFAPDMEATDGLHPEPKHTLVQRDSDLRFVQRLARRNGFLFWVTCDAFGIETAHFKRPPLKGSDAAELIINLENPSVDALNIEWDVERPTSAEARQLDLNTAGVLDGGAPHVSQVPLGDKSLSAIATGTRSLQLAAPADDVGDLRARAEGALIEAGWFLRARCRTSLEALGAPVRSHTTVNLRGAGTRHSGRYFVASVRHLIDPSGHLMDIEMLRNGWGG
jgi:hypothetical protein